LFESFVNWDKELNITKYGLRSRRNKGNFTQKADLRGVFPEFIRKTDQERIQNLKRRFEPIYVEGIQITKTSLKSDQKPYHTWRAVFENSFFTHFFELKNENASKAKL
jgi:hypothetical protein